MKRSQIGFLTLLWDFYLVKNYWRLCTGCFCCLPLFMFCSEEFSALGWPQIRGGPPIVSVFMKTSFITFPRNSGG